MAVRISKALDIEKEILRKSGIFDGFIDLDSFLDGWLDNIKIQNYQLKIN